MKLFRKVMSGLLAGSLILSLVACGAGPGATETGDPSGNGAVGTPSASGDEIVVNVSDNVTLINLEVYANNNSCEFLYADLVFDPLYYGDRQGNNSPCICTSYDLNEDGTEVTLHIKEGVKFHDGTDLNAEDVVATFEFMLRNMDTLGLASAVWSNLESVELIDEYTCKITLSQYFATFENSLTYTWILSDEDIEQYGDDFQSAERVINGSGPWKFVEWQDGQYARYTPNQNYWDPDAVSNIDTLNVWFVNQENAKVSGITSGNLDYTQSLRSDMVPLVENLEGVEVIEYTSDVMYYMQFDCAEDSIFSDPNARKAAAYALDVNTVLGLVGGGEKMNCMFLPSLLALFSTFLSLIIGTVLGIIAGFKGGILDAIIMRSTEVTMAVPTMTLGVVIMAIFGTSIINLLIVMVISYWMNFARVARNEVIAIRGREFVQASRALGATNSHIMFTQILPNVTTSLIICTSNCFGSVILTESTLSYLYLGVQLPTASWGNMIAAGKDFMAVAPWTVIVPGVALMMAVMGFNFLGDGLRDVLDPKQTR